MTKKINRTKQTKKRNWFVRFWIRIFRFFVPKDFKAEVTKGMMIGEQVRQGKITPKVVPTWWLGKLVRRLVDPKRKMKVGEKK